jgi:hypothetical protein
LCIQKKRTADRTMLPWNECALATEHNTQTLALDWGCPKERDKKKAPQFFDSPQSRHSYCLSLSLSLSLSHTHTHTHRLSGTTWALQDCPWVNYYYTPQEHTQNFLDAKSRKLQIWLEKIRVQQL